MNDCSRWAAKWNEQHMDKVRVGCWQTAIYYVILFLKMPIEAEDD